MKNDKLLTISVIPGGNMASFAQRENQLAHTSYYEETVFYTYLQSGDVDMVRACLKTYINKGIFVGKLSDNELRQMQYWAICCVTLGIRYAIQGGLDEMLAFNKSDDYIMHIDKLSKKEEIAAYLEKIVIELTQMVRDSAHPNCPAELTNCLNYIDKHLHEKIKITELAQLTGYSEDYFTRFFNKHIGQNPSKYITNKKLEAAKSLLRGECDEKTLGYYLGFCSQTYFISCFKKAYGVTPHVYAKSWMKKNI